MSHTRECILLTTGKIVRPTKLLKVMNENVEVLSTEKIGEEITLCRRRLTSRLGYKFGVEAAENAFGRGMLKILGDPRLYDPAKSKFYTWFSHVVYNYCVAGIRTPSWAGRAAYSLDSHGMFAGSDDEACHHERLVARSERFEKYLLTDPEHETYDPLSDQKLSVRVKELLPMIKDGVLLLSSGSNHLETMKKSGVSYAKARNMAYFARIKLRALMELEEDQNLIADWKQMQAFG